MPDQDQQKRVDALNRKFIEFGLTTPGDLKFKWMHASEMHWYILADARQVIWTPTVERKATRYSYADVFGPTWILAHWVAPIDEDEWFATGRGDFPWPSNGEYQPIENFCVREGKEPTEVLTQYVCKCLRRHLDKVAQTERNTGTDGVRQLVEQNLNQIEAEKRSERSRIESQVDDIMTAYGKVPGCEDGGVGLGYSRRKILDSGGTPIDPLTPEVKEGESIQ